MFSLVHHLVGAVVPSERELMHLDQMVVEICWCCLNCTSLAMAADITLHNLFTHSFHTVLGCNVTVHLAQPCAGKITNLASILCLGVLLMHVLPQVYPVVRDKKATGTFDWRLGSTCWNLSQLAIVSIII